MRLVVVETFATVGGGLAVGVPAAVAAALVARSMLAGVLFNLLMAGYGYVDEFVTPLRDRPRYEQRAESMNGGRTGVVPTQVANNERARGTSSLDSDRATTVLTIMMMLAARHDIMGQFVIRPRLRGLGWTATGVMTVTVLAMFATG